MKNIGNDKQRETEKRKKVEKGKRGKKEKGKKEKDHIVKWRKNKKGKRVERVREKARCGGSILDLRTHRNKGANSSRKKEKRDRSTNIKSTRGNAESEISWKKMEKG